VLQFINFKKNSEKSRVRIPCAYSSISTLSLRWLLTNIFIVAYTSVSPKKYFAKNLMLCESRNLLFSTASSVTKLQFGGFFKCSYLLGLGSGDFNTDGLLLAAK